jgi:hypothetical protein
MKRVARGSSGMALLLLLPALLTACGGMKTASSMDVNFSSYAHQVTDGKVALYWNCSKPEPGVVRVQGVANNPYMMSPIQDLEFRLYGVSAQGYTMARARADAKDYWIQPNSPSPFTINIQTQGVAVRFDLGYSYMLSGDTGGGGRFGGGDSTSAETQNMARNICADLGP